MKIKQGFISNSSSSSFIISKYDISAAQLVMIFDHARLGKVLRVGDCSDEDAWYIHDDDYHVMGSTFMDNFNMFEFLSKIGVPEDKIEWGD